MILIGNGPLPFALTGSVGPGANATGVAPRSAAHQNGTVPEGTIPAAAPERSGQPVMATVASPAGSRIRAVLATSRVEAGLIDPEDLHRTSGQTALGHSAGEDTPFPQHLEYRSDPPAPLTRYASVPTEITAEIHRLRSEIAELKAQIAEAHARADTADEAAKPCPASEPPLAAGPVSTERIAGAVPEDAETAAPEAGPGDLPQSVQESSTSETVRDS